MRSLTSLGIGLGLVFGCLLLALVAELYYLLWWKKRINHREIEDDYSTSSREFSYLFCWKKPSSLSSTALNPEELCHSMRIMDPLGHHESDTLQSNSNKDFLLKPFGEDTIEAELIRLHNLAGPPRFLFTIKEETKEDLEAEDRSRKGSRSLADLLVAVETPFLTPLSSPPIFSNRPLTPINCHRQHGFNPLFESSSDAEMNRRISSPPPKFKFLKDAEDKLYRRILMEEAEKRLQQRVQSVEDVQNSVTTSPNPSMVKDEEHGSFVTIIVDKNKEKEHDHLHHHVIVVPQHYSTSSQVSRTSSCVIRNCMSPEIDLRKGFLCHFYWFKHTCILQFEVEISEDMKLVHFDFNSSPFVFHDDVYILKLMQQNQFPENRGVSQSCMPCPSSSSSGAGKSQ